MTTKKPEWMLIATAIALVVTSLYSPGLSVISMCCIDSPAGPAQGQD